MAQLRPLARAELRPFVRADHRERRIGEFAGDPFITLDGRSLTWLCGLMAVLGAAGIASIWLTLPGEIDTWSGLVVEYQYGIWLTTLGLAVGAVAALVGINDPGADPV